MAAATTNEELIGKAVTAFFGLVLVAALALLPPFDNDQLADAEASLRTPLAAFVVALLVIAVPLWRYRIGIGLVIIVLIAAGTQVGYLIWTTRPGSDLAAKTRAWVPVMHSGPQSGHAANHPNFNGEGSADWGGSHVVLRLQSRHVGTQQFLPYDTGPLSTDYSAQVLLRKTAGSLSGGCMLAFGYISTEDFYVFRVKQGDKSYGGQARVVHVFADGTQSVKLESRNLPYVNRFSLPRTWENDQTKLSMLVVGQHYTFYVNDREVFSRDLPEVPNHFVTVAALDPGQPAGTGSDIVCDFDQIDVRHA